MRSSSSVNPHLLGALGLTLATAAVLGAILLFGDPDGGRPAVQVSVPPAPEIDVAENTPVAPLRGDQVSLDDPSLDQLAPPPENASDVSLDGLDPIDPDAPVRTRAELAAAQKANSNALPNAPVAGLTEPGPGGPLPVIGPNGQSPADAYKRPFENSGKPAIALVVGGLGMSEQRTRTAIAHVTHTPTHRSYPVSGCARHQRRNIPPLESSGWSTPDKAPIRQTHTDIPGKHPLHNRRQHGLDVACAYTCTDAGARDRRPPGPGLPPLRHDGLERGRAGG